MGDPLADALLELNEVQNEALLELLPSTSPLKGKLQNKLVAADVVRRYLSNATPDKSRTDWRSLLLLALPLLTILVSIIATLLDIDVSRFMQ